METKKENGNGGGGSVRKCEETAGGKRGRFGQSNALGIFLCCAIVIWSGFLLYSSYDLEILMCDNDGVYERNIHYMLYALMVLASAGLLSIAIQKSISLPYMPGRRMILFAIVMCIFAHSGLIAFVFYMVQVGEYWLEDPFSWRIWTVITGLWSFLFFSYKVYRHL